MNHNRGYFAIGIEHGKTTHNLGTLWRSANIFGAAFIFTIGQRYKRQITDTLSTPKHIPLFSFESLNDLFKHLPYSCPLIGMELDKSSKPISTFKHPERACYLLGAEDHGLTKEALSKCHHIVQLPGEHSLNVAVAGSIVMFDRESKINV